MVFLAFLKTFSLKYKGFEVLKNEKWYFLIFFRLFLLKNKGFGVLKNEKWYFLIFKDFFVEEQRIWSSKK